MTCKTHPDAPHGFVRNASHSEDRYVCECEFWEPPEVKEQEPFPVQFIESDYERGFIDGMQEQMRRSVDRAVNAMAKREWVGLEASEYVAFYDQFANYQEENPDDSGWWAFANAIEQALKEKNQ